MTLLFHWENYEILMMSLIHRMTAHDQIKLARNLSLNERFRRLLSVYLEMRLWQVVNDESRKAQVSHTFGQGHYSILIFAHQCGGANQKNCISIQSFSSNFILFTLRRITEHSMYF